MPATAKTLPVSKCFKYVSLLPPLNYRLILTGDADEYGWKIIHSDVFRFPQNKMLFCSVLGVGSQLICMATTIIFLALLGQLGTHRHGAVNAASCFLYALTSFISGFVACRFFKQMGEGFRWVQCVHLTSCLFAVPFFVLWGFQNTVAWLYNSTQALPITTVILMMAVWLFVGKHYHFEFLSK